VAKAFPEYRFFIPLDNFSIVTIQTFLPGLEENGLDEKITAHRDNFKTRPTANTDGIGNCLQQPGQLINQLNKSMQSGLIQLIKLLVP